ncbi:RHS repeat-associated core domain-containing protein [Streptomyces sp. NPDC000888]
MAGNRPSDWHVLDLEKDPTPGDPDRVRQLSKNLLDFADDVGDALRLIKGMADEEAVLQWAGKSAKAFQDQFSGVPKQLKKLRTSYDMAGGALAAYWPKLERAQALADRALANGRAAQTDLSSAKSRLASADSWVTRAGKEADKYKDDPTGSKSTEKPDEAKVRAATRDAQHAKTAQTSAQSDVSSAQDALDAAKKMAADARKMREDAAREAKTKIDEASDAGIRNRKWWEEVGDWFTDNWDTIVTVCKVVVAVVGIIAMIIGGPILGVIVLVAALVVLADTLNKYAKGQASLWDVAFAALDCIPGMKGLTTLGGLAKGLKGGAAALKGLRGGLKGMGLAARGLGKSARGALADGAKGAYNRLKNVVRSKGSDPVDMATGAMYLPQTDVELPGTLPLAFTRRVASDYRTGWWFGPTWASTLDQHLEVDEDGIVFVTEDGLLLAYPHPTGPGTPVLPATGPRWPLTRLDDGGYRLDDPLNGHARHFTHLADDIALLTRIVDRNHNTITFDYDEHGTPCAIRHSGGYHLVLTTDEGRVTGLALAGAAEDGSDVTIKRYGYTDGNLTEVINSSGLPLKFTYDERLRVTSWTDTNHSRYTYTYNDQDRCIAEGGEAGHITITLDYDSTDPAWPDCRITTLTTAEGATTRFVINDNSQVIAEIDPLGHTTRTTYDEHHHVVSWTNELGHTTVFDNNETGQPISITYPNGATTQYEYDEHSRPLEIILPNGATWRYTYDERGNCVSSTDSAGSVTRRTFDVVGGLATVRNALGNLTHVRCTAVGLPTELTDPLGHRRVRQYDAFGRVTSMSDELGSVTRIWWTPEGRMARVLRADGSELSWAYDGEGNCIRHIDATGSTTAFEYTHFDMLSARVDPGNERYEFDYDAALRLKRVINPQGLTWTYDYDAAGNLMSESDFDNRTVTYDYDAAGQLRSRTNALGQLVRFERDELGKVIRKDSDGFATTYEWDASGHLTRASSPHAALTPTYDPNGLVTSETVNGRTTTYTHDVLGRRTGRTTPIGATSAWTYDAAGRRSELRTSGRTLTFEFDAAGRETHRQVGADLALGNTFDELGRLTAQLVTGPAGRQVQHRSYTYRADGHLTASTDLTEGARHFGLDSSGRVTAVHARDWAETYAYDTAGNQTLATWPATHPGHESTGPRDYVGTHLTRAGSVRYEYDAQGRVVLRQKSRVSRKPDTWRYSWDAEDRLVSVITPDGTRWRYAYDPVGRRIAKQRLAPDGESVTEQVDLTWDGPTLCEQTTAGVDLPNRVTLTWDHQGLRPVTQTERLTAADISQSEIDSRFFAIVTDLIGTPSELVDEYGDVVWRTRTTLWGNTTWNATASAYTPLRFPGQYFDPETELHYNYFRHYDPETGRYTSPDPLGLIPAPNPVTYVKNPHTQVDPLGLSPYPNAHLADLPIHSRYDRFYVRAGELVDNRIASHPLTEAQMYGGEIAGHGGVRNLANDDLTRFGGPQGNDPISGYRDFGPGDSINFPGSRIHITGGHHRTAEVVRRIGTGEMDPNTFIEFALRE